VDIHRSILFAAAAVLLSSAGLAQVPVAELATPPANARHFVIQSTGGKHGDSWIWLASGPSTLDQYRQWPPRRHEDTKETC
jgi:hypothetical protein